MRHVRDFENTNSDKEAYCLFVAPQIHRDTVNTFWNAIKYEYEGSKQKIIPMTITQFVILLETLLAVKKKRLTSGIIYLSTVWVEFNYFIKVRNG